MFLFTGLFFWWVLVNKRFEDLERRRFEANHFATFVLFFCASPPWAHVVAAITLLSVVSITVRAALSVQSLIHFSVFLNVSQS